MCAIHNFRPSGSLLIRVVWTRWMMIATTILFGIFHGSRNVRYSLVSYQNPLHSEAQINFIRMQECQFILAIINIHKDHPMTLILRMKSFLLLNLTVSILGPDDLEEHLPTIKMFSWSNSLYYICSGDGGWVYTSGQVHIEPNEFQMEQFIGDNKDR